MPKAVITLTDTVEGQFQANVEYEGEGGFDQESLAHLHAFALLQHLGELAAPNGDEQTIGNAPIVNQH